MASYTLYVLHIVASASLCSALKLNTDSTFWPFDSTSAIDSTALAIDSTAQRCQNWLWDSATDGTCDAYPSDASTIDKGTTLCNFPCNTCVADATESKSFIWDGSTELTIYDDLDCTTPFQRMKGVTGTLASLNTGGMVKIKAEEYTSHGDYGVWNFEGYQCVQVWPSAGQEFLGSCGSGSAGVNGDPHVRNVEGEKMDIYKTGWLSLMRVSLHSRLYLSMDGRIAKGPAVTWCGETYLTEITLQTWRNEKLSLKSLQGGPDLSFNGKSLLHAHNCNEKDCKVSYNGTAFAFHASAQNHHNSHSRSSKKILISLQIKVDDAEDIYMSLDHVDSHFNLQVKGLNRLARKFKINGILGSSGREFSEWTTKPSKCQNLVGLGSSTGSGSKIIATDDEAWPLQILENISSSGQSEKPKPFSEPNVL